jgi:prevent-host-death family protein
LTGRTPVVEHTFVDVNDKGNVAELAIAAEAADVGLSVLKPLTEHERYDLVLGIGGRLYRVQCKWGSRQGEVVNVRLRSSYHSPTRGYVTSTYDSSQVDAVAVYCRDLRRCYLLPVDLVAGRGAVALRLSPARNSQRAALNLAAEYEFRGAVAQLEERVAGSDEVRGSSPLSSTAKQVEPAPALEVGAHEFRNRFGLYMERAAEGAEILISRHGRAYARLGPPALNRPPVAADD